MNITTGPLITFAGFWAQNYFLISNFEKKKNPLVEKFKNDFIMILIQHFRGMCGCT